MIEISKECAKQALEALYHKIAYETEPEDDWKNHPSYDSLVELNSKVEKMEE